MRWWVARDGRRIDVSVQRVGERFEVTVDGHTRSVELVPIASGLASLLCADGRSFSLANQRMAANEWRISLGEREFQVKLRDPLERLVAEGAAAATGPAEIRAPIPGKVVSLAVAPGDTVEAGRPVLVLEAMKMENQICADGSGTVEAVLVSPGATVEGGQLLVLIR